jgi:hypothetical protein
MPDPFALKTADARFNPNEPVTINGYKFIPASEHDRRVTELLAYNNEQVERRRKIASEFLRMAEHSVAANEIWGIIADLTEGEGNTVTVLCPNPDFNGQPNYAIECCGDWTDWQDRRFAHDSRIECFRMAWAAHKAAEGRN